MEKNLRIFAFLPYFFRFKNLFKIIHSFPRNLDNTQLLCDCNIIWLAKRLKAPDIKRQLVSYGKEIECHLKSSRKPVKLASLDASLLKRKSPLVFPCLFLPRNRTSSSMFDSFLKLASAKSHQSFVVIISFCLSKTAVELMSVIVCIFFETVSPR